MAKEAGAKKVFFASAAPPVRYSNVYGIDIPTRTELIAHQRTEDEIAQVDNLRTHPIHTPKQLRSYLLRYSGPIWSFKPSC